MTENTTSVTTYLSSQFILWLKKKRMTTAKTNIFLKKHLKILQGQASSHFHDIAQTTFNAITLHWHKWQHGVSDDLIFSRNVGQ